MASTPRFAPSARPRGFCATELKLRGGSCDALVDCYERVSAGHQGALMPLSRHAAHPARSSRCRLCGARDREYEAFEKRPEKEPAIRAEGLSVRMDAASAEVPEGECVLHFLGPCDWEILIMSRPSRTLGRVSD